MSTRKENLNLSVTTLEGDRGGDRLPRRHRPGGAAESASHIPVIVVHHRQGEALSVMLESVRGQGARGEVLVVDTSGADSTDKVPGWCRVLRVANRGYAAAVNEGARHVGGEIVAVCNADVVLPEDFLSQAAQYLKQHGDVGVVTPRLVNVDGSEQHGARRFYTWGAALWARCPLRRFWEPRFFRRHLMAGEEAVGPREIDWSIGAVLVVRRSALSNRDEVFDARYRFYMEDVDLCLDMWRRGWKVVQLPGLVATHVHGRASRRVFSAAGFHHLASFVKFAFKYSGLPQRVR